jgi:hypothetical protein
MDIDLPKRRETCPKRRCINYVIVIRLRPSMCGGVVIRVVTVASLGNGSLSSSPQADGLPRSSTNFGANEKKTAVIDSKTNRAIDRDFITVPPFYLWKQLVASCYGSTLLFTFPS